MAELHSGWSNTSHRQRMQLAKDMSHRLQTREWPMKPLQPSRPLLTLQLRMKLNLSPLMLAKTRVTIQIWKKRRAEQQKMQIQTMEHKMT